MSIRDLTFYDFHDILRVNDTVFRTSNAGSQGGKQCSPANPKISRATWFHDLKVHPLSGNIIYACGTAYPNASNVGKWLVYRSINRGVDWEVVDEDPSGVEQSMAYAITIDGSGSVYVAGCASTSSTVDSPVYSAFIRKSSTGNTGSWTTIDSFNVGGHWGYTSPYTKTAYTGIAANMLSGAVYACGIANPGETTSGGFVRYSADGSSGSFTNLYGFKGNKDQHALWDIEVFKGDGNNKEVLVFLGTSGSQSDNGGAGVNEYPTIWYSQQTTPANHSGNIVVAYQKTTVDDAGVGFVELTRSGSSIWACGQGQNTNAVLCSSSLSGSSGSWRDQDHWGTALEGDQYFMSVAIASDPQAVNRFNVYVAGFDYDLFSAFMRKSDSGVSASFSEFWQIGNPNNDSELWSGLGKVVCDGEDIFICGCTNAYDLPGEEGRTYLTNLPIGGTAFIKKGKRQTVSASIGPQMLATSFGYPKSEMSGVNETWFKLNNVSEFPHSSGIWQMPNLILGTKTTGKVGKTDDSLVQVTHIGSFVRVLWPKQSTQEADVHGYEAGRTPGILSVQFQPGESYDATQFDHLALSCYALRELSGTLDSVLIKIETKPLLDSGFTTEQTIEQSISSSYSSEAIYRDEIHRKDINYGDDYMREIGWKIPVSLQNVKEIRVSARHKNGQMDDANKKLLIMGRFIKSNKETNET